MKLIWWVFWDHEFNIMLIKMDTSISFEVACGVFKLIRQSMEWFSMVLLRSLRQLKQCFPQNLLAILKSCSSFLSPQFTIVLFSNLSLAYDSVILIWAKFCHACVYSYIIDFMCIDSMSLVIMEGQQRRH